MAITASAPTSLRIARHSSTASGVLTAAQLATTGTRPAATSTGHADHQPALVLGEELELADHHRHDDAAHAATRRRIRSRRAAPPRRCDRARRRASSGWQSCLATLFRSCPASLLLLSQRTDPLIVPLVDLVMLSLGLFRVHELEPDAASVACQRSVAGWRASVLGPAVPDAPRHPCSRMYSPLYRSRNSRAMIAIVERLLARSCAAMAMSRDSGSVDALRKRPGGCGATSERQSISLQPDRAKATLGSAEQRVAVAVEGRRQPVRCGSWPIRWAAQASVAMTWSPAISPSTIGAPRRAPLAARPGPPAHPRC